MRLHMAEAAAQIIQADRYEEACDHAIEACNGDKRSAIKSLLILVDYLEHELELAKNATSLGYQRGRAARVTRAELAEEVAADPMQEQD